MNTLRLVRLLVAACIVVLAATRSPGLLAGGARRVEIPDDLSGAPGAVVAFPVLIDDAAGVVAVEIEIAYDPAVLAVDEADVVAGALLDDPSGLFVVRVDGDAGSIWVAAAMIVARGPGAGALVEVGAIIHADAPLGASPVNLVRVSLDEDRVALDPAPSAASDDEVDGSLAVLPPGGGVFIRSDANADLEVDISDPTFTLNFLFLGGPPPPCRAAVDANGDGTLDISDPTYTLNYLFLGGPPPPAPFPTCGFSSRPGDIALGCEDERACG